MIFSIGDHVEQIKNGTKFQTRRKSNAYLIGKTYSIQPKRGALGISEGRIKITEKIVEKKGSLWSWPITDVAAQAEGGYTPKEFEELYEKMYPDWQVRFAYKFKFIPQSSSGSAKMNHGPLGRQKTPGGLPREGVLGHDAKLPYFGR